MRSVCVLGIGETKMGKYPDRSLYQMIKEAGEAAIEDAGIDRNQIQMLATGNFVGQQLCGQGHLGSMTASILGIPAVPTFRTEAACCSGSLAFRIGVMAIQSGMADIVMVGGVEKMTHQKTSVITDAICSAMDYEYEALAGHTFPANYGLLANRYFYEYRNVRKEMAMCAVNAHHNAMLNPDAQFRKEITIDTVLESAKISDPLTLFDCSPTTDGAAFLVLGTKEIAKDLNRHRVVELIASSHTGDTLTLASKSPMTSFGCTTRGVAEVYKQSGMKPSDIDLLETHDCFSITQIINLEDLGFFEHGHAGDAIAEGKTRRDGIIPVNVSGGLKGKGHPIGATGISQIYEVVTQIRGEAGERQLPRADVGMNHNMGGMAATCVINIFKGE